MLIADASRTMCAAVTTRSGPTRNPVPVKLFSHLVTLNCPTPDCVWATTSGQLLGTASVLGLGLWDGLRLGAAVFSLGTDVCVVGGPDKLVEDSGEDPDPFVHPVVQRHKLTTAATAQKMVGLRLMLINCLPVLKERDNSLSTWACATPVQCPARSCSSSASGAMKIELQTMEAKWRPLRNSISAAFRYSDTPAMT
jgi:hypothetical protein